MKGSMKGSMKGGMKTSFGCGFYSNLTCNNKSLGIALKTYKYFLFRKVFIPTTVITL